MKLTPHSLLELFNQAGNFEYKFYKHPLGRYQLDVTVGYRTTYTHRNVPDIISLLVDGNGEVDDCEYIWFCDQMDGKLQEKKEQQVKEARRKELLASMSDEDKELLGLK
jgi:hypothetical protein